MPSRDDGLAASRKGRRIAIRFGVVFHMLSRRTKFPLNPPSLTARVARRAFRPTGPPAQMASIGRIAMKAISTGQEKKFAPETLPLPTSQSRSIGQSGPRCPGGCLRRRGGRLVGERICDSGRGRACLRALHVREQLSEQLYSGIAFGEGDPGAAVRPVMRGGWRRPPPISSIMSFPPLPVRQWVLSLPKRLRYFLKSNPAAVTAVAQIQLRVIRQELVKRCHDAPANARHGGVSFIHRFGDALTSTSIFTAASSTPCSSSTTGSCESASGPRSARRISPPSKPASANACCAGSSAAAGSTPTRRAPCATGTTTAAFHSMRRYAFPDGTGPVWSGCCAIARARR